MTQKTSTIPTDLAIPSTHDLTVLQAHMRKLCTHFGWETQAEKKFLLMVEEVGEVASAIRKYERILIDTRIDASDKEAIRQNLGSEMADVFSYLMDLANQYDIDLGQAYTKKMTANFSRTWE